MLKIIRVTPALHAGASVRPFASRVPVVWVFAINFFSFCGVGR